MWRDENRALAASKELERRTPNENPWECTDCCRHGRHRYLCRLQDAGNAPPPNKRRAGRELPLQLARRAQSWP